MKTLLTIHDIDQPIDAIKPVIQIAEDLGAHLDVVALGLVRTVPATAAPGVPAIYFDEINNKLIEEGKERVEAIEQLLQKAGLSASVTLECRDIAVVEQIILGHAMLADATLFRNQTVLSNNIHTRSFNGALLNSGRPVIVLGSNDKFIHKPDTVMYAWNGEAESAKAIYQSLNWLGGATKAHVVLVDPDEYQVGPNPGDNVAAYLARKNLAVTVDRIPGGHRNTSEVLLEHAGEIGADLLVMGAYGHSRFREWLLGGTTRSVLEDAKIPVLMAH